MAKFFIHRPVFAIVISLIILIAGGVSIFNLPIAQYPQIAPPNVEVEINYQGANAETVEQSIASVVEAEVNGAERMIYMSSKSSSDGRYVLTCTFEVGTNLDLANVDINNRVSKAQAKSRPRRLRPAFRSRRSRQTCFSRFRSTPTKALTTMYFCRTMLRSISSTPSPVPKESGRRC